MSSSSSCSSDVPTAEVIHQAAIAAAEYVTELHKGNPTGAAQVDRRDLERLQSVLGGPLPEGGSPATQVIDDLTAHAPACLVPSGGPRWFRYVIGGAHPAATAADMLVVAWDQCAGLRAASPGLSVIEEIALDWVIQLVGFDPGEVTGGFTTGTTTAHITGLLAARAGLLAERGWDVAADGLYGAPRFKILVSADAHVSSDQGLAVRRIRNQQRVPGAHGSSGAHAGARSCS